MFCPTIHYSFLFLSLELHSHPSWFDCHINNKLHSQKQTNCVHCCRNSPTILFHLQHVLALQSHCQVIKYLEYSNLSVCSWFTLIKTHVHGIITVLQLLYICWVYCQMRPWYCIIVKKWWQLGGGIVNEKEAFYYSITCTHSITRLCKNTGPQLWLLKQVSEIGYEFWKSIYTWTFLEVKSSTSF